MSNTNAIQASVSSGSASHPAVRELFDAFAAGDIDGILKMVTPDVELELGNSGPIRGTDAARVASEQIYAATRSIEHDVINEWIIGDQIIVQATATYHRTSDGKRIRLPSMTAITLNGDGLMATYKVFFDLSPLFAQ